MKSSAAIDVALGNLRVGDVAAGSLVLVPATGRLEPVSGWVVGHYAETRVANHRYCRASGADDFVFVESAQTIELLSTIAGAPLDSDPVFLDSWNRLEQDQYMADGGQYRKRRHATYAIDSAGQRARLMPYQPHYQTVDYNPLNGGVARYFAPILDDLHQSLTPRRAARIW